MPIANYINQNTGEIVEYFTIGRLTDNIEIDGIKHTRTYNGNTVGFKFKGPGFYQTDYKDKERTTSTSGML